MGYEKLLTQHNCPPIANGVWSGVINYASLLDGSIRPANNTVSPQKSPKKLPKYLIFQNCLQK